jgi:hypothetical protein
MTGVARRLTITMTVAVGVLLAVAASAWGAEYSVHACGAVAGYQNHLLTASASDGRMTTQTECPTDGNGHNVGVAAMAGINKGTVPVFASAAQTFVAPAGTTINHVHLKGEAQTWNGDWVSLLQGSTDRFGQSLWNVSGCTNRPGQVNGCVGAVANVDQEYDLPGLTGIRAVVACGQFMGCTTFGTGVWPFTRAYYFIREFDASLEDDSAPSIPLTGGNLPGGEWLHGTQVVRFDAHDNSGISRSYFTVDELGMADETRHDCDYTYAVPCSDVHGLEYSVDTARLSDGAHRMSVGAVDATGANTTETPMTVLVDNHAPAEPAGVSVEGGEGWHTSDAFSVSWSNPASAAPITRAYYELCRADGTGCSTSSQESSGIARLSGLHVGSPGDYTIRVWLMDAAGNVSEAKSPPVHLKFDNVPPAQAAPQHRNGWLNDVEAKHFTQEIKPPLVASPPVSGIAGYAVTIDGSVPGTVSTVAASDAPEYLGREELTDLPDGVIVVRARAISGAGVPSPLVGSTELHVDRGTPNLTLADRPDPKDWIRAPVELQVTASDPGQLSGMASAPADRGPNAGGFVEYAIDDGPNQRAPGPVREFGVDGLLPFAQTATADITVATDGHHVVHYRAADVAGNQTVDSTSEFKIDQTPPELAVFEAEDPSDPRLITVAAADRTSGLADGGTIRLRRISPTRGAWLTLHTTRRDDRYYVRVDNSTLPEGDYEFEASIPDQAGNEATANANGQGEAEIIHITPTQVGPYLTIVQGGGVPQSGGPDAQDAKATVDTRMQAQAVQRTLIRKCKPPRPRLRGRTCSVTGVRESLVHDLRVPFGKQATVRGSLTTATGSAVVGAEVTVLRRLTMAGAEYIAEGAVRTNSAGAFTYNTPAGAGRTLDFHYAGDSTYKHSDEQVTLRVPAFATIKASRHSVRNGQRVSFSGKLSGRPYPAKGKILDLQAFYRNKWRTFATPRAGRNGVWGFTYRFGATRGSVLYRFRIHVRATSDYPYEPAYSRAIPVRVFGAGH